MRLLRWLLSWFLPLLPRSAILLDYPSPVVEPAPVLPPSPPPLIVEPPPVSSPRAGIVRLHGRAFADDGGPYAAWGVSLFWGLWAAKHDRPKLDTALTWIAGWGVDYVRVLSMVGSQPYWQGREIDPRWSDYTETLCHLLDACWERRVRVQVVLFADAQVMMPDQADRLAWVDTMIVHLETRRHAIQFVEIANESNLNGIDDANLAALTRRWMARSTIPIAPSSPDGGNAEESINRLFREQALTADLLTPHFDRRIDTVEGLYRPVRQPWEVQFYNTPTTVFTNNEPIGPGSSGAEDMDGSRLAMAMATTYIAGGAGYVLHSAAGVRGDVPFDEAISDEVMGAMETVHDLIPGDLANGHRQNHHWAGHPYKGIADQIWPETRGSGVVRAYASETAGEYWVGVMGLKGQLDIEARWDMQIAVYSMEDGHHLDLVILEKGRSWIFHENGTRDFLHRVSPRMNG